MRYKTTVFISIFEQVHVITWQNYEDSDQTLHTVSDLSRNCLLRHVPILRIITYVHMTDFHGGGYKVCGCML